MITAQNIFKEALLGQLRDLLAHCTDHRIDWLQEQITTITCLSDEQVDKTMYIKILTEFNQKG